MIIDGLPYGVLGCGRVVYICGSAVVLGGAMLSYEQVRIQREEASTACTLDTPSTQIVLHDSGVHVSILTSILQSIKNAGALQAELIIN